MTLVISHSQEITVFRLTEYTQHSMQAKAILLAANKERLQVSTDTQHEYALYSILTVDLCWNLFRTFGRDQLHTGTPLCLALFQPLTPSPKPPHRYRFHVGLLSCLVETGFWTSELSVGQNKHHFVLF